MQENHAKIPPENSGVSTRSEFSRKPKRPISKTLHISKSRLEGELTPPPSIELASRLAWASSLGGGGVLGNMPNHPDIKNIFNLCTHLGADIKFENKTADIFGAQAPREERALICYDSKRISKFALPLALTFNNGITSLKRPSVPSLASSWLDEAAAQLHVRISKMKDEISVAGPPSKNLLQFQNLAGAYWLPGFALAFGQLEDESVFMLDDFVSTHPAFKNTLEAFRIYDVCYGHDSDSMVLTLAGLQSFPSLYLDVPASWKEASYYLGAFLLAGNGTVFVSENSHQPEKDFWLTFTISRTISSSQSGDAFMASASIPFNLPKTIDPRPYPSLIPLIILLATQANSPVEIGPLYPISPLSKKRARLSVEELTKIGAKIESDGSSIIVHPSQILGGNADSHGDCRLAMALVLAGLISHKPIQIQDGQIADKENPNFISDLKKLGAKIA